MAIDLPRTVASKWRRVGSRTGQTGLSLATVTAETTLFEHEPTADALASLRNGGEIPARSLFTVDLSISPSLSVLGLDSADALEKAAPKARDQFVETLADDGIEVRGERASEGIERPDGTAGRLTVLEIGYPIGTDAGTDEDETIDDAITAEAHVAVWPAADAYAMTGGLFPLEDPSADASAADLGVDADRDRETIVELFRTIDLGSAANGD